MVVLWRDAVVIQSRFITVRLAMHGTPLQIQNPHFADDGEREKLSIHDKDITWIRQENKANLQKAKSVRREFRAMEKSADVAKSAQAQLCALLAQAGAKAVDGIGPAASNKQVLTDLDLSPMHTASPLNSKGLLQGEDIGESTVASESAASAAFGDADSGSSDDDDQESSSDDDEELESSDDEDEEEEASDSDDEDSDEDDEDSEEDDEEEDSDDEDSDAAADEGEEDIMGSMILEMHRPEAGGAATGSEMGSVR